MFKLKAKEQPNKNIGQFPKLPFALDNDPVTRIWLMGAFYSAALLLVFLSADYFDTRLLNGVSLWAKPSKFSISLAIHFLTLAILAQQLESRNRVGLGIKIVAYASVASLVFELLYIPIQAARGRASHFNMETEFESLMYALMGVGSLLLVLASFVLGIMLLRHTSKNKNPGLRLGSILGLIVGSILTLIFAGYMSATPSHFGGEIVSDANGIPLVGWSRQTGDFRVAHFMATHMMQIAPLIGWWSDKRSSSSTLSARVIVTTSTVILTLISGFLFIMAWFGQSIFPY